VLNDESVDIYESGEKAWTIDEVACRGRPLFVGSTLVVADADATVSAFGVTDHKRIWQSHVGGAAAPRLTAAGDLLLAEADKSLHALGPGDGKTRWRFETGDRLAGAPVLLDDSLILASKLNRIDVLDKATGVSSASTHWPTWITALDARRIADRAVVACSDLRGRITLLDGGDLSVIASVDLDTHLVGPIRLVPDAPERWQAERQNEEDGLDVDILDLDVGSGPAVLCTDDDGFVYVVKIPG
jgi:hypothetical protein